MSSNTSDTPKRRLGRGLSSLIRTTTPSAAVHTEENIQKHPSEGKTPITVPSEGKPREIAIDQIAHNPHQPRKNFDETQLAELAQSIRQEGILQPLVVTASNVGAESDPSVSKKPYTLIAGERRLRAAAKAGLSTVPCVLRDATDRQMIEWAVIENIQRADLNPIERGLAYREYMDRFHLTQEQVAQRMGQPRATVANYTRMLDLCDDVQALVARNLISFGHAKVLAGLAGQPERQLKIAQRVVVDGLSVRSLEGFVTAEPKNSVKGKKPKTIKTGPTKPAYVRDAEQRLTEAVGTRVTIMPGRAKNSGKILLEYYNLEDFDRIATALGLDSQD